MLLIKCFFIFLFLVDVSLLENLCLSKLRFIECNTIIQQHFLPPFLQIESNMFFSPLDKFPFLILHAHVIFTVLCNKLTVKYD